jgi:hypothetical protein
MTHMHAFYSLIYNYYIYIYINILFNVFTMHVHTNFFLIRLIEGDSGDYGVISGVVTW